MAIITTDASLLRLLQMASATLPVGAYAFSLGLESAVTNRWVRDSDGVEDWLSLQLEHSLGRLDIPVLLRLHGARSDQDDRALAYWNNHVLASRETREALLTDTATGESLYRLLRQSGVTPCLYQPGAETRVSFLTAMAELACHWDIDARLTCLGFTWSWLENQVVAATKLIPLGQSQAQQLLTRLREAIPPVLDAALELGDDQLGASLPGLAIASMQHEVQYSRLFRS